MELKHLGVKWFNYMHIGFKSWCDFVCDAKHLTLVRDHCAKYRKSLNQPDDKQSKGTIKSK